MSLHFGIFKKALLLLACIVLGLFFVPKSAYAAGEFITTWKTDNVGTSEPNQITIPTTGEGYNFDVDWGDASSTLGVTTTITHSYPIAGTYTVTVSGTFPRIYFNNSGDKLKILSIEQWGTGQWDYMYAAFKGASNLIINAVDAPDLSNVTTLAEMFNGASSINADLSAWDVSNVTSMGAMFYQASSFNGDVTTWDVSNVTDISGMFGGATVFNRDISAWDVSNVTTLNSSFTGATNFNQDIGGWNVSNVTNMDYTFYNATNFNQDLSAWDVSNVTSMISMFNGSAFNQPLNVWDVSSVTNMVNMFYGTPFNQALNLWDVSSVSTLSGMFSEDIVFNQDISDWDVSSVTDMSFLFYNTQSFNQDISSWNVSNVTNMSGLFAQDSAFNQALNSWDVSNVTNMASMFRSATVFNQPLNSWDVSNVSNMGFMFDNASAFDQDISVWDVSNVNSMFSFLSDVTLSTHNYDALLRSWSLLTLQNNVTFNAGNSPYCASPQRSSILSNFNWTITSDGGLDTCHTVTYSGGAHGSISGFASQGVENASSTLEVSAVPNSGYRFVSWSDGSTLNPRRDTNVVSDMSVTAQFKRISRGGGGARRLIIRKSPTSTPLVITNPLSIPVVSPVTTVPLITSTPGTLTPCSANIYPTQSIRRGVKNDETQVKLLQQYLNTYEHANLVLDGVFDADDETAVIAWQEKYASEILAPWGIVHGTGYIYKTSLQKLKTLFLSQCEGGLPLVSASIPTLFTRDLKFDMVGADVRALQQILGVKETGYFGPLTEAALIEYQKLHNIVPTSGYFGPVTRAIMNNKL